MAYHKCASIYGTANSAASVQTASGAIANFNTKLAMPIKSLEIDVNATQEAGTPTPQSPKAISGVSEINVVKCGKNLFDLNYLSATDITIENGVASGRIIDFHNNFGNGINKNLKFLPLTSYSISFRAKIDIPAESGYGLSVTFVYTDNSKTFISCPRNTAEFTEFSGVSNPAKTVKDIGFSYGTGGSDIWYITDIQLEQSPSPTTYEPYNGNTYNILFPPYSENMPYFAGLLAGTHRFVDLGSLTWNVNSYVSTAYNARISDIKQGLNGVKSNILAIGYNTNVTVSVDELPNNSIMVANNSTILVCRNDLYDNDKTSFVNSLANCYLIYELETPTTPTITPEQLQTLLRAFAGVYYGGYVEQDKDGHRKLVLSKFGFNGNDLTEVIKTGKSDNLSTFQISLPNNSFPTAMQATGISSAFSRSIASGSGRMSQGASGIFCIIDNTLLATDTASGFVTWLVENDVVFCYRLSEPIIVPLPDGTPIKTLPGVNNIYADTGDTEVAYKKLT